MDQVKTGKLISKRRQELGLSQKDVANRLHVSDSAVSKWERGLAFPDSDSFIGLSKLLYLTPQEIVNGEANPLSDSVAPSKKISRSKLMVILGIVLLLIVLLLSLILKNDTASEFKETVPKYAEIVLEDYAAFSESGDPALNDNLKESLLNLSNFLDESRRKLDSRLVYSSEYKPLASLIDRMRSFTSDALKIILSEELSDNFHSTMDALISSYEHLQDFMNDM